MCHGKNNGATIRGVPGKMGAMDNRDNVWTNGYGCEKQHGAVVVV